MFRAGASVTQVAKRFRVANATVYKYFPRTVLQGLRQQTK